MKKIVFFAILAIVVLFSSSVYAQLDVGADLMSRYLWRGINQGNAAHFHPWASYTTGGFTAGVWGAYALDPNIGTEENDFSISYTHSLNKSNSVTMTLLDIYYGKLGGSFADFKEDTDPTFVDGDGYGGHTIEAAFEYSGLFHLLFAMNVYNDEDNSAYAELGYSLDVNGVGLYMHIGGSLGESTSWYGSGTYGTKEATITNVGLTARKNIEISDKFSLPISASWIWNPDLEESNIVLGVHF
ncbi:MAG: hypothetical protein B6244_02830 [Candidatus Cloacimonetes bacterium 4572_55]|nr:MAG: hypothetical protein B6244_02830 [Candidatus Cloacimonetes bacterium 4572_55]